jgi:metal-responsive CopG/Arc/MetJ family transcriptional regulator
MATIQIVIDNELLQATDKAAKSENTNRSALIRQALQDYLKKLRIKEMEERDRLGYLAKPQTEEEFMPWVEAAVWPED